MSQAYTLGAGEDFLGKTIGAHPGAAAIAIGALVVVLIVLVVMFRRYKAECVMAGVNAMAYVHTGPATIGPKAGFAGGYAAGGGYSAGDAAGGAVYNRPGPPSVCGRGWDPAASAEAEALATVGALQHESYGEHRLQGAVGAAYDSSLGMSDEQLRLLMHQGGTP